MINPTGNNNTPPQRRNKLSRVLRAVNPLRLFRRSIPQAGDTPIRVQSQTQRPQQTGDNNSIQSFGTTINSNNLQQMQQQPQTQHTEINLDNPLNPRVLTTHSELDQSRYAEINLDNPINPSVVTTDSGLVQNTDNIKIHLVNNTSILKANHITIQSELANNLNPEKKLNSAIKKYPDISCITHPDAPYIQIQYAHNIQENEIPLKVSSMIQDLERTHNKTKNALSTDLKRDTQTKIDLVSRTTSQRVASLVLGHEQSVIGDNYSNSLFSEKQKKRLIKTAFPE